MNAPLTSEQQDAAYLARLGERVRASRTEQAMTRKTLSEASGVSERYLAQLESGQGNMSVLLLRKVARAMGVTVERLVADDARPSRSGRIALERVLAEHPRAVIATGGSLVTDAETYGALLQSCLCLWLKASPEEHMSRVIAQGDMRPFKGRSAALMEIKKLLKDREALYARADAAIETSGKSVKQSLEQMKRVLA
jgi:XRE family aerobic/anaerobic benzoate catabolism transcriptional regulator